VGLTQSPRMAVFSKSQLVVIVNCSGPVENRPPQGFATNTSQVFGIKALA